MPRPKLTAKMTIRLYDELRHDVQQVAANRRFRSTNEFLLHCLEYEMSRSGLHTYDSYGEILPILNGEVVVQMADKNQRLSGGEGGGRA